MATANAIDASEAPGISPWLISGTVTIATFMEVLDTSIANVSLPHIAGDLAVSQEEATWVLTTYLVANAIVLPLSGRLSAMLGRKRYYMACVALFTLSSALCGMATSLPMLLAFRALQGLGGGGLQPSTQGVLLDTFPLERRGMAMAIYGMCILVAPILGPTLGGWITDNYSWRWIFYINLPAGCLSLVLNYFFLTDPPYLVAQRQARRAAGWSFDYLGFSLLALGLGALEIVLDKGQEEDWFSSHMIVALTILAVVGLLGLIAWELYTRDPLINLRLLKDRNFLMSSLLIFGMYAITLGSTALLPLMLQSLMGYDATHAGLVMMPAGIFTLLLMPVIGAMLSRQVDARWIITVGLFMITVGTYWMAHTNLDVGPWQVIWPRVVQMVGAGMTFTPLNTTAYATLPREQNNYATGLYNLLRNEGGSVGTGLVTTLLARREQFHLARLGEHISRYSSVTTQTLQNLAAYFHLHTSGSWHAQLMGWTVINDLRERQAAGLAYYDIFWIFSLLPLVLIPLVWVMRRALLPQGTVIHGE